MYDLFQGCNLNFVYDQTPVGTGCTKLRPDFVFTTLYGILIVENDEHKHMQYTSACELNRMQEIQMSYGEAVHFIRFNPHPTSHLPERHAELLRKVKEVLEDPASFFERHTGLTVSYMYYE